MINSAVDHFVYRLYDAEDRLLYVGCSRNVAKRKGEHRRNQPWGHEIARHEADGPFRYFAAVGREASQIRTLRPLYNVVHNPRPAHRSRPVETTVERVSDAVGLSRAEVRRAMWAGEIPAQPTDADLEAWVLSWPTERAVPA